jgi:hypothetical protein
MLQYARAFERNGAQAPARRRRGAGRRTRCLAARGTTAETRLRPDVARIMRCAVSISSVASSTPHPIHHCHCHCYHNRQTCRKLRSTGAASSPSNATPLMLSAYAWSPASMPTVAVYIGPQYPELKAPNPLNPHDSPCCYQCSTYESNCHI